MIRSGMDEAGLGPILGPYCAASVRIQYSAKEADPLNSCSSILSGEPSPGKLAVGDSKKIFSSGKILELEKTVLSFHCHIHGSNREAPDAFSFLKTYCGERILEELPWFNELKELSLPLGADDSVIKDAGQGLTDAFREKGIRINSIQVSLQPALQFNRLLTRWGNKARVCQEILSPLLKEAVGASDSVIVDRQGGRRYYGDWLINLFPGQKLLAVKELKEISRYTVDGCLIDFQVKADALCFETALASLFAKYSRELCMKAFNSYWKKKAPHIKETAGYYTDGKRFIKDLKESGLYPDNDTALLRNK